MAPLWARLDADHDRRVTQEEYGAVVFSSRTFEEWDTSGDGVLTGEEIAALWLEQDPSTFFPTPPFRPDGPLQFPPLDVDYDVLRTLREEVLAKTPDAAVPSDAELRAVADVGGLDSPAARNALKTLQTASEAAGLAFPRSLAR